MNTAYVPTENVAPASLRLQNMLSSRQIKMPIMFGGHEGELEILPELVQRDYNMALQVLINQVPCCVMLDISLLDWYLSSLGADVDFASLPDPLRQSVILRAANELATNISERLGVSVSVQQVSLLSQLPDHPCRCCVALKLRNYNSVIDFSFAQDAAFVLEKGFSSFPTKPKVVDQNLPLLVRFEKGRTVLTYEQLQGLELFDVILFDQAWQDVLVLIQSGPCMAARCQIYENSEAMASGVPGQLQEAERLDQGSAIVGFEIVVEVKVEEPGTMELPEGLNGVPVTVTFELGRQEMPMGEVASLDQGYTFSLQANAQAPVEVRANGRLIGLAELVQIGDNKLGARLVSLQEG